MALAARFVLAARSSVGRDLLLETWLISRMRAQAGVTTEEYCRALDELVPARPAGTTLDARSLSRQSPRKLLHDDESVHVGGECVVGLRRGRVRPGPPPAGIPRRRVSVVVTFG